MSICLSISMQVCVCVLEKRSVCKHDSEAEVTLALRLRSSLRSLYIEKLFNLLCVFFFFVWVSFKMAIKLAMSAFVTGACCFLLPDFFTRYSIVAVNDCFHDIIRYEAVDSIRLGIEQYVLHNNVGYSSKNIYIYTSCIM